MPTPDSDDLFDLSPFAHEGLCLVCGSEAAEHAPGCIVEALEGATLSVSFGGFSTYGTSLRAAATSLARHSAHLGPTPYALSWEELDGGPTLRVYLGDGDRSLYQRFTAAYAEAVAAYNATAKVLAADRARQARASRIAELRLAWRGFEVVRENLPGIARTMFDVTLREQFADVWADTVGEPWNPDRPRSPEGR